MKEEFLQYLWLNGNFDLNNLKTTKHEDIVLIKRGNLNTDSGPDFSHGELVLNNTKWVGSIEIHINSSEWYSHKHHKDKAYNNVILHVVYNHDKECYREDSSIIPCLELKDRINPSTLFSHNKLTQSLLAIPCQGVINKVSYISVSQMLERSLIERLEERFAAIREELESNKGNWQETFYRYLLKSFGFKTNSNAFHQLATSLPLNIIAKHKDNNLQLEALLYGQAGMLNKSYKDVYPLELYKEYEFLKKKYGLKPMNLVQWKFMRMRPANFPTIRISQFANLIHKSEHLFSKIIENKTAAGLFSFFDIRASEYWNDHYKFDSASEKNSKKRLGKSGMENLIINTVVPFLFAYAKSKGDISQQEQAINILLDINAENNKITKQWKELNIHCNNAFESQAQIQLFNSYCTKKKCLDCGIGKQILQGS